MLEDAIVLAISSSPCWVASIMLQLYASNEQLYPGMPFLSKDISSCEHAAPQCVFETD